MNESTGDKFYYALVAIAILLACFVIGGMAVIGYQMLRPAPWGAEPTPTLFILPSIQIPSSTPEDSESTPESTPTPGGPTLTPTLTSTGTPEGCTDIAAFVRDVTIPDNTVMAPNEPFTKTWRLRNDGTCTWTNEYSIVFSGSRIMGGPSAQPLAGDVAPGEEVNISLNLLAPAARGTYRSEWLLRSPEGALFGVGEDGDRPFWAQVVVREAPAATPLPTRTPFPTTADWRGEYFNTIDPVGNPVFVRNDPAIDFNWDLGVPDSRLPVDSFSVRWTRTLNFETDLYRFRVAADDGIRMWVDNQLIVNEWRDSVFHEVVVDYPMTRGEHALRVEYYEHGGTARARVVVERLAADAFPEWRGEYWPNAALTGDPAIVRNDQNVNFDWGVGAADSRLPSDGFSARWTRTLNFEPGQYRFTLRSDDGVRMWVDGQLVIDDWRDGTYRDHTATTNLTRGRHTIRVEYYENVGAARVRLIWEKLGSESYPDWRAEYWPTRNLSGSSFMVRNDRDINFDWGSDAPISGMPDDNFSVRWTRTVFFHAALYRFHAQVDDGVRIWVDDHLVLDSWRDGSVREVTADYAIDHGNHRIRVEYYDRTVRARIRVWCQAIAAPTMPPSVTSTATVTDTPTPTETPTETPTDTPSP